MFIYFLHIFLTNDWAIALANNLRSQMYRIKTVSRLHRVDMQKNYKGKILNRTYNKAIAQSKNSFNAKKQEEIAVCWSLAIGYLASSTAALSGLKKAFVAFNATNFCFPNKNGDCLILLRDRPINSFLCKNL